VWTQEGVASWYGEPFHGRTTASGETYDMEAATAAHPTLPFGTRVRVENLDNGRAFTVRINDRGPFAKERILDVSRRAARELGMLGPGTARVRITVIR
jgi:rare lipoprotein A